MNLLLTGCFKYTKDQMETLRSLGFSIYFMQQEKEKLLLPASEIDAIVCNGLFLSHDIDLFTRVKFIQLTSAGFDRVPLDKIKNRSIELYNARGVYSTPMAEWALFRVLEQYKQGWFFKQEQAAHRWTKHRGLREISGIRVAVIGAGNVGQEVAKRFSAMDAYTVGFDIHTNAPPYFNQMKLISTFVQHVNNFDVIVVTAPLLPSTKGLISRDVLISMKEGAILINIARGGLIDEQAMCDVLAQRKDLFVALDQGKASGAIMAIENTVAGGLLPNYSLLHKHSRKVKGEVFLRIQQNLMALPGQTIEEITEVHSHYMAIAQTREFFKSYPHIRLVESEDTAKSAADIMRNGQRRIGAIASELAAELFGLEILQASIETHKQNFTRFLILDDHITVSEKDIDKSSICFTLPHKTGRLSQVLSIFAFYDLNLTKIQSLPIPGKEWQYFFYVDLKFDDYGHYLEAMNAVRPLVDELTVMGEYKSYC